MKILAVVVLLSVVLAFTNSPNSDAPTGFDNKSNGMVDGRYPSSRPSEIRRHGNRGRRSWTALQRPVLPGVPPEPNV